MRSPDTKDYFILVTLSLIWAAAFFNIKIATYSYDPITLASVRVIFASIPLIILCKISKILRYPVKFTITKHAQKITKNTQKS